MTETLLLPPPDEPPPTIAEMIAELGASRSYAEQITIERMRELERDAAKFPSQELMCWIRAHDLRSTVLIYREYSGHAPIAGYPNRPVE